MATFPDCSFAFVVFAYPRTDGKDAVGPRSLTTSKVPCQVSQIQTKAYPQTTNNEELVHTPLLRTSQPYNQRNRRNSFLTTRPSWNSLDEGCSFGKRHYRCLVSSRKRYSNGEKFVPWAYANADREASLRMLHCKGEGLCIIGLWLKALHSCSPKHFWPRSPEGGRLHQAPGRGIP